MVYNGEVNANNTVMQGFAWAKYVRMEGTVDDASLLLSMASWIVRMEGTVDDASLLWSMARVVRWSSVPIQTLLTILHLPIYFNRSRKGFILSLVLS